MHERRAEAQGTRTHAHMHTHTHTHTHNTTHTHRHTHTHAQDEGKMTFPGGIEPRDFDLWHEYLANQEFARAVPVGSDATADCRSIDTHTHTQTHSTRHDTTLLLLAFAGVRNGLSGGMAISMPAIAQFWDHPSKAQVVEQIILGQKRSCLAITEPHAGSTPPRRTLNFAAVSLPYRRDPVHPSVPPPRQAAMWPGSSPWRASPSAANTTSSMASRSGSPRKQHPS